MSQLAAAKSHARPYRSTGKRTRTRSSSGVSGYVVTIEITRGKRHSLPRTTLWEHSDVHALGLPIQWALERTADGGIRVIDLCTPLDEVVKKAPHEFSRADLAEGAEIELPFEDGSTWNIQLKEMTRFPFVDKPAFTTALGLDSEKEQLRRFKKNLGATGLALSLILTIALLIPKPDPKEEELVPEQFTKIIMARPKKLQKPAAGSGAAQAPSITKAKDSQVAQAFRSKALSSAVKGLLKGGMTKLLAQSSAVTGAANSMHARSLFAQQGNVTSAPVTGMGEAKNVQVSATGTQTGQGVGYGKGQSAGVAGQGSAYVGLDLDGVAVEEGLSMDEVGAVIHKHMSEIRYCYESAMLRNPHTEGRLLVAFTINPGGHVASQKAQESSLGDPKLDDCILRRLARWDFPKPKGGSTVAVSYPFIFKPLSR